MSSNFFVAQQTDQVGVRNPSGSVAARKTRVRPRNGIRD
jgi:hypothetical protein